MGERILYYDTDSIIFWTDEEHEKDDLSLCNYLGDLTNEIDDDDYFSEFISCGSKNYAHKTHKSGITSCKVRGFTLNWDASQKINLDLMQTVRIAIMTFIPDSVT